MGPLRETKSWNTRSVDGVNRFLGRAWRLFDAHLGEPVDAQPTAEQLRTLHATIKKVSGARFALFRMLPLTRPQRTRRKCGSTPRYPR